MSGQGIVRRGRRGEQGQTILLVAISIVALLAMAALAIDVVSLYLAKSEIQRAADAIALAGAKAVADSGVTTLSSTDPNLQTAETLAQSMATSVITAMLSPSAGNLVSGQAPTLLSGGTINWNQGNNNPTITVTLQQTNLPTFFARIFARNSAMTQATATAEVFNPANMSPATQIQEQCVKPWLVANCDPYNAPCAQNPIVNPASGAVEDLIGDQFYLSADCYAGQQQCQLHENPPTSLGNLTVDYVPAVPGTTSIVPACGTANDYQASVAGCDPTPYTCGGGTTPVDWSPTDNPEYNGLSGDTAQGTACLTTDFSDQINYPSPVFSGPPQIKAGSGPLAGQLVTTSNSVVTIPIFEPQNLPPNDSPVTIVGFLQAFIDSVGPNPGFPLGSRRHSADLHLTVMNVVGCSTTANTNPTVVGGNGASAIPVRLITPP